MARFPAAATLFLLALLFAAGAAGAPATPSGDYESVDVSLAKLKTPPPPPATTTTATKPTPPANATDTADPVPSPPPRKAVRGVGARRVRQPELRWCSVRRCLFGVQTDARGRRRATQLRALHAPHERTDRLYCAAACTLSELQLKRASVCFFSTARACTVRKPNGTASRCFLFSRHAAVQAASPPPAAAKPVEASPTPNEPVRRSVTARLRL
jgi:hypothetical protein